MKRILLLILILFLITSCSSPKEEVIPKPVQEPQEIDLFFAIHNEPSKFLNWGDYQAEKWPSLVALIESADNHNQKLTLLFNPQWADYILEDDSRLALVRSWEANGHELGVHCHGIDTQVNWNGYSNIDEAKIRTEYIGDMDDMMDLLNQLPASGQMKTSATTDDSSDLDYPPGIIYDVDGGMGGTEDLVSTPTQLIWGNSDLIGLKHARYSGIEAINIGVGIEGVENAIENYQDGEAIGIVFHTFDYGDDSDSYDFLFNYLDKHNVHSKTVSEIHE